MRTWDGSCGGDSGGGDSGGDEEARMDSPKCAGSVVVRGDNGDGGECSVMREASWGAEEGRDSAHAAR